MALRARHSLDRLSAPAQPPDATKALLEAAREALASLLAAGWDRERARRGVTLALCDQVARASGLRAPFAVEATASQACAGFSSFPLRWLGAPAVAAVHEGLLGEDASRARQGSYYTPPDLARAIARLSLVGLDPDQARVLDPAVGCGPFLLAALDLLVEARIARGEAPALGSLRRASLASLAGADRDPGALAVTRLALWLYAADDDGRCPPLPGLVEGDALLGEPLDEDEAAGLVATLAAQREVWGALRAGDLDRADAAAQALAAVRRASAERVAPRLQARHGETPRVADWARWFPADLARGGFDAVLGNPPYRRERAARDHFAAVRRAALGAHARPRGDLWFFFSHLALDLLRPGGRHAFLVPAYWLKASGEGAAHLRDRLQAETAWRALLDLGRLRVFAARGDAGVAGRHVAFVVERGGAPGPVAVYRCGRQAGVAALNEAVARGAGGLGVERSEVSPDSVRGPRGEILLDLALDAAAGALLERLRGGRLPPGWILSEGITPNPERLGRSACERFPDLAAQGCRPGDPVFVVPEGWAAARALTATERGCLLPWLAHARVPRLRADSADADAVLLHLTHQRALDPGRLPALLGHLGPFRPLLEARREVRRGKRRWFELHWPRRPQVVAGARVLIPRMVRWPGGAWIDAPVAVGESVYVLAPPEAPWARLAAALLNALPFAIGLLLTAKRRGIGVDLPRAGLAGCPWPTEAVFAEAAGLGDPGPTPATAPAQLARAAALADRLAAQRPARHDGPWWRHPEPAVAALGEQLDRAVCALLELDYAPLRALADDRLARG